MGRVEDLIYAERSLTGVRSANCDRVHALGSRNRIYRKGSGRVGSDAAGFGKTKGIVIGDQDCISHHALRHKSAINHGASQLPGSREQFIIPLGGGGPRR